MPHSCAFGCKYNAGVVLHVFPNPHKFPERFQAWVELLGEKLESPSDFDFFMKKRICDIHFTNEHRNRFKRLNALAVPTLNLPGSSANITASVHALDRNSANDPNIDVAVTASPIPVPSSSVVPVYCLEKKNITVTMRPNQQLLITIRNIKMLKIENKEKIVKFALLLHVILLPNFSVKVFICFTFLLLFFVTSSLTYKLQQ